MSYSLPQFLTKLDAEDLYGSDNYVTLDFETDTSGGTYGSAIVPENGLVLSCWKRSKGHVKGPGAVSLWGTEFETDELLSDIRSADFIVAHNAKYELMWLKRCGLDLGNIVVFDTKIAEYVLLGNLAAGGHNIRPVSTSLGACAVRRGLPAKDPVVDIMMSRGINPTAMPKPWLEGRCVRDVWETEAIFLDQRETLIKSGRLEVLMTRCLLTPVLAAIEFEGMRLDGQVVEDTYKEYKAKFLKLTKDMDKFTGGINWRSAKQSAEFLYNPENPIEYSIEDRHGNVTHITPKTGLGFKELTTYNGEAKRTAGGNKLTDQKTLERLKATTKRQREFLSLRKDIGKVNAALTKSLEFFLGVVREREGTFYAEFNQTTTATHRLSSKGISLSFDLFEGKSKTAQFQNLARVFKKLFRAKNDSWLMAECDGSQLEFRVAAFLGNDSAAKMDISSKHDVHRFTAAQMNDIEEGDVTPDQRQDAKSETFKPLYGGTKGTKKQEAYYAAFRERYPELSHTQEGWVYEVLNSPNKRLDTDWGLRYYFPYAKKSYKSGYCNATHSIYNYPIQALATAEIIPIALVYFWHRVRCSGLGDFIKVVNTVHDSVICELHPDYVEQFKEIALQAFTKDVYLYLNDVYGMHFDVPLGAGIKIGSHWSLGKEESYNVDFNGNVERVS